MDNSRRFCGITAGLYVVSIISDIYISYISHSICETDRLLLSVTAFPLIEERPIYLFI
jgi:hypothetical protein